MDQIKIEKSGENLIKKLAAGLLTLSLLLTGCATTAQTVPTETQTAIREEPDSDSGLLWVCGGLGAAAIGTGTAFVLKKKSKRT